jgi:hypothetical protein
MPVATATPIISPCTGGQAPMFIVSSQQTVRDAYMVWGVRNSWSMQGHVGSYDAESGQLQLACMREHALSGVVRSCLCRKL